MQRDKRGTLLLIGANGNWARRIMSDAEQAFCRIVLIDRDEWAGGVLSQALWEGTGPFTVLVTTPPDTHQEVCRVVLPMADIDRVYCEKPFPDIERLRDVDGHERLRVVDHYLLKGWGRAAASRNNGTTLTVDVLESAGETRRWMRLPTGFGGVVYDLAHHALALFMRRIGRDTFATIDATDIAVEFSHGFPEGGIRETLFTITVGAATLTTHVGKECDATSKGASVDGVRLADGMDLPYRAIFGPESGLATLDFDEALVVNSCLSMVNSLCLRLLEERTDG